ncbi:hypothetical protein [Phreatobacter stygius]|uniref:Uncharacterized protein n=1 Tax=Phreatobacter stygius TaxID=1940610 RepID=A0A4D7B875_9HYPH|nr:hypothetical protein [Phreatobacter stygius]QCI67155.1 hypothetical protein E8M01_24700 [Phreatobacter stygius]
MTGKVKRMRRTLFGMTMTALLLAASVEPVSAQASRYTRHVYATCPEARSPEPGVIEVRRCRGVAGIPVLWMSEPDSSSVGFGSTRPEAGLDIGTAFEAGATIEWRSAAGEARPMAAIVRHRVGSRVGALNQSRLVIYRLEASGRSCVMAVATGGDANDKARAFIDASARDFACGTSRRVAL